MPLAWRLRRPIDDVDAVVSSSHACAKAVRVVPQIPHVCYCHTPMRYAWDFESEASRFPTALRGPARVSMRLFRRWDRRTAGGVTRFVANSTAVAARIRKSYGRDAEVVFPPVRTDYFTPDVSRRRTRFLYVGRLDGYKRPELVIEAFRGLDEELLVVGEGRLRGQLMATAPPNVSFVGAVEDAELRELYREAVALVHPAEEDFGIVMAEAQACGTPVIGMRRGGAADIVAEGVTGWLIDGQDVGRLRSAVRAAAANQLDHAEIVRRAERFAAKRFRSEMRRIVKETMSSF
jgi:glycosyltransferase involved in cell wall biosynthesis